MRGKERFFGNFFTSLVVAAIVPGSINYVEAKEQKLKIIEEVLVSARKREENQQEVPVAITAIGAEELRQKGIGKPDDLQMHTPGLEIRTAGLQRNNLQFFLRGQGQTFGSTPGVIIYFSEAQLGNSPKVSIGNNGQFFDLASVQVLKGPQGTLFGRSTTGGAVLFDPKHPSDEFGGFLQLKAGDFGMEEYTGAVTLPIIDGVLSARLAGNLIRRDGFTDSLTTGQEFDDRNRNSYRLGVSFTPTDWLDTYTLFQHNEVDENNTGTVLLDFNENNPLYDTTSGAGAAWFAIAAPPIPAVPALAAGGLCYNLNLGDPTGYANCSAARLGLIDSLRDGLIAEEARVKTGGDKAKRYNTTGGDLVYKGKNQQLLNITKIDLGEVGFLGDVSLKNVFNTVKNLGVHTKYDSGSPIPNGLVYNNYTLRNFIPVADDSARGESSWFDDFSEEFQVLGLINDKHSWILGFYYEQDYDDISSPPLFSAFADAYTAHPVLYPSVVGTYRYKSTQRDKGYFAQTTLDLSDAVTEGLNLTLGYRWSETKVKGQARQFDPVELVSQGNLIPGVTVPVERVDDSAPSWNVSVDYQWNDDTLVYLAHRRGFKPGGTNVSPPQGSSVSGFNATYDPETVDDIELGVKADWELLGRPIRTNGAIYHTWYEDIQRAEVLSLSGTPFTQTANIAAAEIFGLELSAQYQIADRLMFSLNYSYMDAEYTKWPGTVTNILTNEVLDLKDSPYVGAPENQGSISLQYLLPVPVELGDVSLSVDYFVQSSVHLNDTELADGFGKEDGYDNLNLRLSWENVASYPVDLAVFVNNVMDDIHAVSQNSFYSVNGTANAVYSEPRMWGAELRYRFGSDSK